MNIPPYRPNLFHRWIQAVVANSLITRPLSKIIDRLDMRLMKLSGGKYTLSGALAGWPVVLLTTTGAKSGLPRSVPLIAIPDNGRLLLIGTNFGRPGHPAWVHNLRAHPQATISYGGQQAEYTAHKASDGERERIYALFDHYYAGYRLYRGMINDRKVAVMILERVYETDIPGMSAACSPGTETG